MLASVRTTQGQLFSGYWVLINEIADDGTVDQVLETLKRGGFSSAYESGSQARQPGGPRSVTVSFTRDLEKAQWFQSQVKSLGLSAYITRQFFNGTVYFVDFGLPVGQTGATDIIARYGEEKVMLGDRATCPTPN